MKVDIFQCPVCFYTEHQPAGQTSLFLEKCPRCSAGTLEKIGNGLSSFEYDEQTKKKMKELKKKIWSF